MVGRGAEDQGTSDSKGERDLPELGRRAKS
jgi:hypothetical protein